MTMTQIHTHRDDLERSFQMPAFALPPVKTGGPHSRIVPSAEESLIIRQAEQTLEAMPMGDRVKANLAKRLAQGSIEDRLEAAADIQALMVRKSRPAALAESTSRGFHDSVPTEVQDRLTFLNGTNYGRQAIAAFRPPLGPFVTKALDGKRFSDRDLVGLAKAMIHLEISVAYWQKRMPSEVSVADPKQPSLQSAPPVTFEEFQLELRCHGLSERLEDYVLRVFEEQGLRPALDALDLIKQRLREKAEQHDLAERLQALVPLSENAAKRLVSVLEKVNPTQLEANQGFLARRTELIAEVNPVELAKWIAKCDHKADTAQPPVVIPAGKDDKSFARVTATEPKKPKASEQSGKKGKKGK